MRNLKKVLALVVAVAMFASMGFVASAASYSDVATNASYADAVNLLSNLGILTGYEDGTFRPDNTVTRAEAATMMVRMLNLVDGVEDGDTIFTDVKADHWASGYVNVAVANGIVNGMGDGTFEPDGEVTYGQIVKMIVCALGYEPVALANGGWNGGGYIFAGSKAGFTKGVSGTANAAASRATVAKLIYNALEVELMDQTSFSTGINGSIYEVLENKTILSEYLELEKVEGVIVETYLSNVDDYEEGANTVSLVITKNYAADGDENYPVDDVAQEFIADGTDAATLLGYSVVAYVGENEDGDDTMFAVAEKAGKNTKLVLDTDLIVELTEESIKYYKSESARSTTTAEIQNYVGKATYEDDELANETYAIEVVNGFNVYAEGDSIFDKYKELDEITLLDNDGDGDFEFIFATIPTEKAAEFVVEEVIVEDWYIDGETDSLQLDYDDVDKLTTIIKDGKIVELDAVAEGDVVTVLDTEAKLLTVYVSSVAVEGTVDEVEDGVYTIAGKDYELSPIAMAGEELSAGDEGIFYINAIGKIASVDTVNSVAGADYVYIIGLDTEEGKFGADTTYEVQLVTAAGEVEVLTIKAKKVDVIGTEDETQTKVAAKVMYEAIEDKMSESEVGGVLAKIETTASGEIETIYFAGAEDFVADDTYANDAEAEKKSFNSVRSNYGIVDLDAKTLVFHIDTKEAEESLEDAVTVTTAFNLFVDGSSYSFVAYGEEDEVAEVLVAFDAKASVDAENPVMVVTKISDVVADDEDTLKVTGLVAGKTVSVVIDPDDENLSTLQAALEEGTFNKGDIILYAENASYATDVQLLYDATDDFDTLPDAVETGLEDIVTDGTSDEDVTIHFGTVNADDKQSTKKFTVAGEEYYYDDNCNVTVVDFSGASVSVKSGKNADVKYSTQNSKKVFVKTALDVEDEVTDIVVFVKKND